LSLYQQAEVTTVAVTYEYIAPTSGMNTHILELEKVNCWNVSTGRKSSSLFLSTRSDCTIVTIIINFGCRNREEED